MRSNLPKLFFQSVGFSALLLVRNYGELLGGGADVRMHVPFPLGSIALAHIADILLLGLVIFAVLAALHGTRFYPKTELLLIAIVAPLLMRLTGAVPDFLLNLSNALIALSCWAVLVVFLYFRLPRVYELVIRLVDGIGILFAAFAFVAVLQLLWVTRWKPAAQQHTAPWATAAQSPRQHPLLVWIVFDELSYQQVFEHRYPGLALPSFDALRAQSTLFTNVQPIALQTAKVIPSLLSGKTVDGFKFQPDNRFLVHYADVRGWHPLNGSDTVFYDAQQQGWRTAAVGWYNPYCTTYGDAIDDCYWMNLDRLDGLMSQKNSFLRNTSSPLLQLARQLIEPQRAVEYACNDEVRQRRATFADLQSHTLSLLATGQADFIFLHVPVPHSPNIWDRANGRFTDACGTSYLDSLALADRILGSYLRILQASPRWKETTLIVEGDHGWRVQIWNAMPAWTDEDTKASDEVFDPRPALMIHRAGQQEPAINSTSWSLLNVHDVIEAVLKQ